jgi:hypothetical protein
VDTVGDPKEMTISIGKNHHEAVDLKVPFFFDPTDFGVIALNSFINEGFQGIQPSPTMKSARLILDVTKKIMISLAWT